MLNDADGPIQSVPKFAHIGDPMECAVENVVAAVGQIGASIPVLPQNWTRA
jgi:hypothetical protein